MDERREPYTKLQFSPRRILIDGMTLNILALLITYIAISIDPMLLITHYPPDIQAAVGFSPEPATIQFSLIDLILGGVIAYILLLSNAKLRQQNNGQLSLLSAFTNCLLLFLFSATWDLLILDWLIFVTIQPAFIIIPGTEGLAGYQDYLFHLHTSFLNIVTWFIIILGSLVLAALSHIMAKSGFDSLFWWVRQPNKNTH